MKKKIISIFLICYVFIALVLVVSCSKESYLIDFEENGGTNYESLVVEDGSIVNLPTPSKEGYVFVGWYDNKDCSGEAVDFKYVVNKEVVLYAKWEAVVGSITFVSNGGTEYENISVNGQAVSLPTPSKENYIFAGWYDNKEYSGQACESPYIPVGDITLYAKWTEKFVLVSLDSVGGTKHEDLMCFEDEVVLPTPTKYGYKFLGWYDNKEYSGQALGDKCNFNEDTTLYAKWEEVTYVYLYYGDLIDSIRYEYHKGDVITVEQLNQLFIPEDLIVIDFLGNEHIAPFMYWAFEGADESSHVKVDSDINVTEEHIVLVAQYDYSMVPASEHLTYNKENNTYTTTGKVAHVFEEVEVLQTPYAYSIDISFSKGTSGAVGPAFRMNMPGTNYQYESGCNYLCPGLDSSSGVLQISKVLNGSWSRLIGNTALESLPIGWQNKFNNTPTNHEINVTITVVDYGSSFEVYIDNELAVSYSNASVLSTMTGTDLGVRSSTTPANLSNIRVSYGYDVNFVSNVYGINIDSVKWLAGDIELPMLTQDDLALAGWYYDEALTQLVDDEKFYITEDTTLYAKWTNDYYTVKFDTNGGSYCNNVNWSYGKLVLPNDPVKMNCVFVDWYYEKECENLVDPYNFNITEDTTLYAKWRFPLTHIVNNGDGTYSYSKKTEAVLGLIEKPIPDTWYYNEYKMTINMVKEAGSAGLAFRMNMSGDYTYETVGSYYLSVQLCTGMLRISQVKDGKWSRINSDIALANMPASWQEKYNSISAGGKITADLMVRDYGEYFEIYVDGALAYTYNGTVDLLTYTGNGYGIRCSNGTPVTFSNVSVETYRGRAYYEVEFIQEYGDNFRKVCYEDGLNEFVAVNSGVLYKDVNDSKTAYYNKFIGWSLTSLGEVINFIEGTCTLYAVYEENPLVDPVTINFIINDEIVATRVTERNTIVENWFDVTLPYTFENGNQLYGSSLAWYLGDTVVDNTTIFSDDANLVAVVVDAVLTRNGVIITEDTDGDEIYTFFGNTGVVNEYGGRYGIGLEQLTTITSETEAKISEYKFTVTVPEKPSKEIGVRTILFVNDGGNNVRVAGDSNTGQYFLAIHWNPHNGSYYLTGKLNSGGKQFDTVQFSVIKDCAYKTKYSSWTSGTMSFDIKAIYGLDDNNDAWFKFYIDDCLLMVYGDNPVMAVDDVNYGVNFTYTTYTSSAAKAVMNYAKDQDVYAGLLDYGVGISMWQDTARCGGSMIYSKISNTVLEYKTVTIDENNGVEPYSVNYHPGSSLIIPDDCINYELQDNGDGSYIGYEFAGWYIGDNLVTDMLVEEDITLTAKWNPVSAYKISFNTNGGSKLDDVSWITGRDNIMPTDLTKENYFFDGWYYDEALTLAYDYTTAQIEANTTLYAKWRLPYSYLVDNGDGTYTYNKKTVAVIGTIDNPIPSEGYYNYYSQTITLVKGAASVGIAFRLSVASDYSYENTGTYYLSVQFCGSSGLRISYVNNGKWVRLLPNNADYAFANLPQAYQDKYNNTLTDQTMTVELAIKDYGSYFEVYLDGEIAYKYGENGETVDLLAYTGNGYGIRSSASTEVTYANIIAETVAISNEE